MPWGCRTEPPSASLDKEECQSVMIRYGFKDPEVTEAEDAMQNCGRAITKSVNNLKMSCERFPRVTRTGISIISAYPTNTDMYLLDATSSSPGEVID
nr:hypothetical protein Iba_chr04bCG0500 [Ipomoea batatas]